MTSTSESVIALWETSTQLCERLGISRRTLHNRVNRGAIQSQRDGRRCRYREVRNLRRSEGSSSASAPVQAAQLDAQSPSLLGAHLSVGGSQSQREAVAQLRSAPAQPAQLTCASAPSPSLLPSQVAQLRPSPSHLGDALVTLARELADAKVIATNLERDLGDALDIGHQLAGQRDRLFELVATELGVELAVLAALRQ